MYNPNSTKHNKIVLSFHEMYSPCLCVALITSSILIYIRHIRFQRCCKTACACNAIHITAVIDHAHQYDRYMSWRASASCRFLFVISYKAGFLMQM